MTRNTSKRWMRLGSTLTCFMSSNLLLSQAFLSHALASEAENDLIQVSDKIKNQSGDDNLAGRATTLTGGNTAAASNVAPPTGSSDAPAVSTPRTTGGNDIPASDTPQLTGGNDAPASTMPQSTEGNKARASAQPQSAGGNDAPASTMPQQSRPGQTRSNNVIESSTRQGRLQLTGGNDDTSVATPQQTESNTAASVSSMHNDGSINIPVLSKVPAFKKIDFISVAFGVLGPGNFQSQGRYFHLYRFKGRENQMVQIKLVGSNDDRPSSNLNLKPYLMLLDPNNQVVSRRGSEGADGELSYTSMFTKLPRNGTYTIAVTSETPRAVGRYSLALREDKEEKLSYVLDPSSN